MISQVKNRIWLAFGSNRDENLQNGVDIIDAAMGHLTQAGLRFSKKSQYYQTPAFPAGADPDFINCVAVAETEISPTDLMAKIHQIESLLGRERQVRWGQRSIDIDLLSFNDLTAPNLKTYLLWQGMSLEDQKSESPNDLILPHPRIQDRAFVLVPLVEVEPEWRHPVLHKTATELLAALSSAEKAEVVPFVAYR